MKRHQIIHIRLKQESDMRHIRRRKRIEKTLHKRRTHRHIRRRTEDIQNTRQGPKTYEAIVKGEEMPGADLPESFKVLLKEFQALALDVELFDSEDNLINVDEELSKEDMLLEYSLSDIIEE